ncbi:MAG: hypothetical protein MI746_09095 [Pseudomonadales bacterium]|nr:hypothetical protein [Pseudomonadales bacterium]
MGLADNGQPLIKNELWLAVGQMLARLIDITGWSHEQWLAASILAFIIITVLVVLHRMMKLFQLSKKKNYQPNLRPLRRQRQR